MLLCDHHAMPTLPLLCTFLNAYLLLAGFRGASDINMPSCSSIDTEPQAPPSAFGEMLRGSSYTRNNSENLKRRNSSMRNTRQGLVQQQSGGQANSLRTIYSSTSMGKQTAWDLLHLFCEVNSPESGRSTWHFFLQRQIWRPGHQPAHHLPLNFYS